MPSPSWIVAPYIMTLECLTEKCICCVDETNLKLPDSGTTVFYVCMCVLWKSGNSLPARYVKVFVCICTSLDLMYIGKYISSARMRAICKRDPQNSTKKASLYRADIKLDLTKNFILKHNFRKQKCSCFYPNTYTNADTRRWSSHRSGTLCTGDTWSERWRFAATPWAVCGAQRPPIWRTRRLLDGVPYLQQEKRQYAQY